MVLFIFVLIVILIGLFLAGLMINISIKHKDSELTLPIILIATFICVFGILDVEVYNSMVKTNTYTVTKEIEVGTDDLTNEPIYVAYISCSNGKTYKVEYDKNLINLPRNFEMTRYDFEETYNVLDEGK